MYLFELAFSGQADKSVMHLAHTSLMLSLCQMLLEPGKSKELLASLDALNQALAAIVDVPHANALYAHLMAEMFIWIPSLRSPLEAARILLQAASTMARFPLMCGLFTERAGIYFLVVGQMRKYVFHEVFAGNKIYRCGRRPASHSAVCFSSAMLCLDGGTWGDLKAKLCRALAQDLKLLGREGAQRSLLLLLRLLSALLNDDREVGKSASSVDVVSVFREMVGRGPWGSLEVDSSWALCSTRDLLLSALPVRQADQEEGETEEEEGSGGQRSEVQDFGVPELLQEEVHIVRSLNGRFDAFKDDVSGLPAENPKSTLCSVEDMQTAEILHGLLDLERNWIREQQEQQQPSSLSIGPAPGVGQQRSLADKWAETEQEAEKEGQGQGDRSRATRAGGTRPDDIFRMALGEDIQVALVLANKMPVDLTLTDFKITALPVPSGAGGEGAAPAEAIGIKALLSVRTSSEFVLSARPSQVGLYEVSSAQWNLSEHFTVRQSIHKSGPLLQKTLQQRLDRERGEDRSLRFQVVPPHPLLRVSLQGLSSEVLQGQLLRCSLLLTNEGQAAACSILIKLSQPSFVFISDPNPDPGNENDEAGREGRGEVEVLRPSGLSCTVVKLDENCVIQPGQQARLGAWLRVASAGVQRISFLVSYMALRTDGSREYFGPGQKCRTSFISIKVISTY